MFSLKAFRLNLLSLWKMYMFKPPDLFMLLTMFNYLTILSALFEMKFSAVRKLILYDFVWR